MLDAATSHRLRQRLSSGPALHLLGLGFEERCLAYPRLLDSWALVQKGIFLALDPGDTGVSWALREKRRAHWAELLRLFPAIRRVNESEALACIREIGRSATVCVDFSSLPRRSIVAILETLGPASEGQGSFFAIYTYPQAYSHDPLQQPDPRIDLALPEPTVPSGKCSLLVIPGFERSYTNLAIAWMRGASRSEPTLEVLLPFPGSRYEFFERVVEEHFDLVGASLHLMPQNHILKASQAIFHQLVFLQADGAPVFVLAEGPRVTLLSVYLAVLRLRSETKRRLANILLIGTQRYNTLRSEEAACPMVEEIPRDLLV